jgi:hypothetical protein
MIKSAIGNTEILQPFEAQWLLYEQSASTLSNSVFYIYEFRTILGVNSDYFLKQR